LDVAGQQPGVDVIQGFALPFVHIAGAGQDPDDGFTIYPAEGGNGVGRWGDYSAAVADGDRIWMANEYIPKACSGLTLPCRTSLANWGTFFDGTAVRFLTIGSSRLIWAAAK
jgi:hypothetical protein